MARKKKGSLELSINAIVIMILAVTLLGLSLGFIKGLFNKAGSGLNQGAQEMSNMQMDELEKSGALVSLKERNMEVKASSPYEFFIGIRNNLDSDTTFGIGFKCISKQGETSGCGTSLSAEDFNKWFQTFNSVKIGKNKGKSIKVKLVAGEAGDYMAQLVVCKDGNAPTNGNCNSNQEYETIDFYLTVK